MRAIYLSFLLFVFAFFGSFKAFATNFEEKQFCSSYYPKLSLSECMEIREIQDSYSSYSDKYKKIALVRANQLQQKSLSLDERAKLVLDEINSNYFGDIPIEFMNFLSSRRKVFMSLPMELKLELVKDSILLQDSKESSGNLSAEAQDYKDSKTNFVLKFDTNN